MTQNYSSDVTAQQYKELEGLLSGFKNKSDLYKKIVDSPFHDKLLATTIDLGIVVLLQTNPETKTIDRVALSKTDLAEKAVRVSARQFHDIKIPVSEPKNLISQVIKLKTYKITEDWAVLFNPVLTPKQARLNQANASIECSIVHPLNSGNGGALIFSFFQPHACIVKEHIDFVTNYSRIVDEALNSFLKNKN